MVEIEVVSDYPRVVRLDVLHHVAAAFPTVAALYGDICFVYRGNKMVRINNVSVTQITCVNFDGEATKVGYVKRLYGVGGLGDGLDAVFGDGLAVDPLGFQNGDAGGRGVALQAVN